MKFSANLGFLWTDRSLPDAVRAAKDAGFDAVECHWPYEVPAPEMKAVLDETGLQMMGLNTCRGHPAQGDNGLNSLPDRMPAARAGIDEAIAYGSEIGARAVHVMAGNDQGQLAYATFIENLRYAAAKAKDAGMTVLIEPLNPKDAPGYFLSSTSLAVEILGKIAGTNVKLMFDCYHVARNEGDVTTRLKNLRDHIGHIQIAGVPDRGRPDRGELNYDAVFETIEAIGWTQPIGVEYKPGENTDETLGWLARWQ